VRYLALLIALTAGAAGLREFEAVEPHMGTLFRIALYAEDEQRAAAAFRAAFHRVRELDEMLSDYKPDSELNRISRSAVGHPVRVSEDLFRVLAASQKLAGETGGAFDVTLGPVIRLWREARKSSRPPDAAAIEKAGGRCGYRKLRLDPANRTVLLAQAGMQLDVGGIAKGYAADAALAVLKQLGIRSALVAASGDLAFSDAPPGRQGWKIGVDSAVLELRNAAVSTSGDAEQGLDANGKRYSHIIDPITHMGLTCGITVTIIAPTGILSDGIATAVSVLGAERGIEFVEKKAGVAALIAVSEGGVSQRVESMGFGRLLEKKTKRAVRVRDAVN
jgi:thiamine biosynthesis lipoprotein